MTIPCGRGAVWRLVDAARELVEEGGAHEGSCTNEFDPDDACELHVATYAKRRERVREAIREVEALEWYADHGPGDGAQ